MSIDWSKYPNFSKHEFDCKHTGKNKMRPEFLDTLQDIRKVYNRPMIITSGYRDKTHPIEERKDEPGEHYYGVAADISCSGIDALELIVIAFSHGIRRIGIHQRGPHKGRFIHIGIGDRLYNFNYPLWTY